MLRFLLWVVLFVVCWPVAVLALVLYPIVWLVCLPFRLLGATVSSVIDLLTALVLLPIRLPTRLLRAV